MRCLVIIIFLALVSCKSGDNPTPSQALGFRAPTCNDAADDGVFEQFNERESASFLASFTDPGIEDTGAIAGISLNGSTISASGSARLVFTANARLQVNLSLPVTTQSMQAYEHTFDAGPAEVDLSALYIGGFPSNCSRLYYVISQPVSGGKNRVVTKGHFDVSVQ